MSIQRENLKHAALVIVGHGSTVNDGSSDAVWTHARELCRRDMFGEVVAGFWKEPPYLQEAISKATLPRVFVLPFFISEGYFSEEAVPEVLGFKCKETPMVSRLMQQGDQVYIYCRPIGTHPSMTEVLLSRARQVLDEHPFPRRPRDQEVTLFIAGHGTLRNTDSRKSVEQQVELIRQRKLYAGVEAVFMEEPPLIADCYQMALTRNIVMVPFFLSDGLHVREDIPVLLGEPEPQVRKRIAQGQGSWRNPTERHGKRLWYSPAVGTDSVIVDVILERVQEASAWKVGTYQ